MSVLLSVFVLAFRLPFSLPLRNPNQQRGQAGDHVAGVGVSVHREGDGRVQGGAAEGGGSEGQGRSSLPALLLSQPNKLLPAVVRFPRRPQ